MAGKTLKAASGIALFGTFVTALGFVNYAIRQTRAEYETLNHIISLKISNPDRSADIALLMAMASKESSFYDAAVGRDNEVGLVQLKPDVAMESKLIVLPKAPQRPSALERILFSEADERKKSMDERFDKGKNLQFGHSYLLRLSEFLQKEYGMDSDTSIDFALISYNLGIGNLNRLLRAGYPKNPDGFIKRIISADGQAISERKRIVVANHFKMVKDLQGMYQRRLPAMIQHGRPSLRDYANNSVVNARTVLNRFY